MPELKAGRGLYMGIDPGAHGSIAVVDRTGYVEAVKLFEMTDKDIYAAMNMSKYHWGDRVKDREVEFCILERVGGFVGGNPLPGSAMFNFGAGYGALKMGLTAAGYRFEEMQPAKWQRLLGVTPRKKEKVKRGKQVGKTKDEDKAQFKRRLKAMAERLFPHAVITLDNCDAILIAEFCRRKLTGTL